MSKLLRHCELAWPEFSDIFLEVKVTTRNNDQNPHWDSSKHTLWQSVGREREFHTSAHLVLRSQTSWFEFAKQNTLIWPLSVEKNVEFPENSVL